MSFRSAWRSAANTAHQVDANVFIGGFLAAANPEFVRAAGIKHIVKLFEDDTSYPGGYHRHPGVRYLVVRAHDRPDYDIREDAVRCLRFIREALRLGEKVLVHCHAGVSRSATVVLLHLMVHRGYDLDSALVWLKSIRPVVAPNVGFMHHLRATNARIKRREAAIACCHHRAAIPHTFW